MEKSSRGLMFWQKIGLLALIGFPVIYIAMLLFSNNKSHVKVVQKPEQEMKIQLGRDLYETGERVSLVLVNVSDRTFYFKKPCDNLPTLQTVKGKDVLETFSSKECGNEFAMIIPGEKVKYSFYPELYKLTGGKNKYQFSFEYSKRKLDDPDKISRHDLLSLFKVYSNEIVMDNTLEQDGIMNKECVKNEGCKTVFSNCDCQFHCVKSELELKDCDRKCQDKDSVQREMTPCGCVGGKCDFFEPSFGISDKLGDVGSVEKILNQYFEAERTCDIELAKKSISKHSQKMVSFTCANMKKEFLCNGGASMKFVTKGDQAVAYPEPFGYKRDNPYFFLKEGGVWKLDLYRMANNITMIGGDCEGWTWKGSFSREEFCLFFDDDKCPAEK